MLRARASLFLMLELVAPRPFAQEPSPAPATATATTNQPSGNRGSRGVLSLAPSLAAQMIVQADKNGDQKLARTESLALADIWWETLDVDGAGRVSQDEFIERFGTMMPPPPGFGVRGGGVPSGGRGGFGASRFLGLFIVLDTDKDSYLTRAELKSTLGKWFDDWDAARSGSLGRDALVAGLNSVLPKTNYGGASGTESQTPIPGLPKPPPSPVLAPVDSMKTVLLPPGFRLELAASEPAIADPISLSFDEDGRAFLVEMQGFMPDIDRKGEREPVCRISLLEFSDRDWQLTKNTVFVDQLVLPRAVAAAQGGILYVSDYKLWFARDKDCDGKAEQNELLDPAYGSGNVEHGPNGLMRAMDNWIYNAESPWRHRFVGGALVKQRTEFRGQWGMTQDNYGRLFYNVNNSQLLGDFVPPNYMGRNPHHTTSAGLNLAVATDQRVFTTRMNTAVNRGYLTNVLDAAGRLYVFSSSCSPAIYRGDNFPDEFAGNAFVCDPSANLLKRNLVFDQNLSLASRFAYENSEFLTSTDERFRPVNLFNGPDGTLWLIDMYRGVVQYGMFMTSYLRRESLDRGLDKGLHLGRLYRIVSTGKTPSPSPQLSSESSSALVARLSDPIGWTRDTAQRLLVERGDRSVVTNLLNLVVSGPNPLGRLHALWTLEGLFLDLPPSPQPGPLPSDGRGSGGAARGPNEARYQSFDSPSPIGWERAGARVPAVFQLVSLDMNQRLEARSLPPGILEACARAIHDGHPKVQAAAIRVAEALAAGDPDREKMVLRQLSELDSATAPEVLLQAALSAGNLKKPGSLPVMVSVATALVEHALARHALLSGLGDWELPFLQILLADPRWNQPQPGRGSLLQALAAAIAVEGQPRKLETLLAVASSQTELRAWRRKSLLDGLAASAMRISRPVALDGPPAAFEMLARSDDAAVRSQGERIKKLFSWPGHQSSAIPESAPVRSAPPEAKARAAAGKLLFEQICAGCHGLAGEGLSPLAPPIVNSSWVSGPENRLIRIALNGVTGPIQVNGTRYQPPQTLPDMPSLREALDNEQIAAILTYIRLGLGNSAAPLSAAQVAQVRGETEHRETPWTEDELLQLK